MYPLFEQFRGKPTWVETGKLKLSSYDKAIEITTYSDGELLIWDGSNNINIGFTLQDVEKIKKLLNAMNPPVFNARKVLPVPEVNVPIKSVFDVQKPSSSITHRIDEAVVPSIIPKVRIIQVRDTAPPIVDSPLIAKAMPIKGVFSQPVSTYPLDIISPSFKANMKKIMDAPNDYAVTELKKLESTNLAKAKAVKALEDAADKYNSEQLGIPTKPLKTEKAIERIVRKEDAGWGSNVLVNGKPVRWYYKTRDLARLSLSIHRIGDKNGRIA